MPKAVIFCFAFIALVSCVSSESKKFCPVWLGRRCFAATSRRTTRVLPVSMSADQLRTRIHLYALPHHNISHEILLHPTVNLNGAPLDRRIRTVIIIHGLGTNGTTAQWMKDLKDAYLKNVPANVFIVDWGVGASNLDYLQVVSNTAEVGKEVGRLINGLSIDPKTVHLIGHSLGAHVASYASHRTVGIVGRITGLDAAQPLFEGYDADVRLDQSDALFVEAIHTNARPLIPTLGLGMIGPIGHVDFYMNSGVDQPGCLLPDLSKLPWTIKSVWDLASIPVEVLLDLVVCPHSRAYEYYIEALASAKDCVFWGTPRTFASISASVLNAISQGTTSLLVDSSSDCNITRCSPVGLLCSESPLRGTFEVVTAGRAPFCRPKGDRRGLSSLLVDGVSGTYRQFNDIIGSAGKSILSFFG